LYRWLCGIVKNRGLSPYYYVDEAQTIFDNLLATIFNDEWNLFGERRELIIGHSNKR
jgi:uncharacterized DUF497 family protein